MKILHKRILEDCSVLPGNILKVDSFLNHQIDVEFLDKLALSFYEHFKSKRITKIITIESSGIGISCAVARYFSVPVVFAKKGKYKNLGEKLYTSKAFSYTKGLEYEINISAEYLNKDDRVLIIDDFLATGAASMALCNIINTSGAHIIGFGCVIEKAFQDGGQKLRDDGYDVLSLARISEFQDNKPVFI